MLKTVITGLAALLSVSTLSSVCGQTNPQDPLLIGTRRYGRVEFKVNGGGFVADQRPILATLSDGNLIAVWHEGSPPDCYGRVYDPAGNPIGSQFVLHPGSLSGEQYGPSVASLPNNGFVAGWGAEFSSVVGRRFDQNRQPVGSEITLADLDAWPALASHQTGEFVAALGAIDEVVYVVRCNPQGHCSLVQVGAFVSGQFHPSVAYGGDARFTVAWPAAGQIRAHTFIGDFSSVGPEFVVNTSATSQAFYPSVQYNSAHELTVAWSGVGPADSQGVYARRFRSDGTPAGPEFLVNSTTAGSQAVANLGVGLNDEMIVTWISQGDVFGRLLDADGNFAGGEFRVNRHTAGTQSTAHYGGLHGNAILNDASVAVGWSGDGAAGAGVYLTLLQYLGSVDIKIVGQPRSRSVLVGQTVSLTVNAVSEELLSYQWRKNGTNLAGGGRVSGVNTATLTLQNVDFVDAGDYSVLVSNAFVQVTSSNALLGVVATTLVAAAPGTQGNVPADLTNAVAIALGYEHGLAVRRDGTVRAWGNNSFGQAAVPTGLSNVISVAGGGAHSLALKGDGRVEVWGQHPIGHLGSASTTNVLGGLTNVVAISAGRLHSLALRRDGTVVAWGDNWYGQTNVPRGLTNIVAVAAGGWQNLALRADGRVIGWGARGRPESLVPAGVSNIVAIAAAPDLSAALDSSGTVFLWGGTYTNVPFPLTNVVAVSLGAGGLVLRADGTVASWGHVSPLPGNLRNVTQIAAGWLGSLALVGNGLPHLAGGFANRTGFSGDRMLLPGLAAGEGALSYQWRRNGATLPGATNSILTLGNGQPSESGAYSIVVNNTLGEASGTYAVTVSSSPPLVLAHPGDQFSFPGGTARLHAVVDGSKPLSYQWQAGGLDIAGQTRETLNLSNLGPAQPASYSLVASNALGRVQSSNAMVRIVPFALWGNNYFGQTEVPGSLSNAVSFAGGYGHSVALRPDGTVVAWGFNEYGQTNVPAGLTSVRAIAVGFHHNLALRSNGTVVGWGQNFSGEATVPSGLSDVVAMAAGVAHSLVLRGDGRVVAWGQDAYGKTNVPPGLSNVIAIAAGVEHSLALRADGTVVAWGLNSAGQTNVPTGLSNVVAIAADWTTSLALLSDGTLREWGSAIQPPPPAGNFVAIAAGLTDFLGLQADGKVVALGSNAEGQPAAVPEGLARVTSISRGGFASYAIVGNGLPTITLQPRSQMASPGTTVRLQVMGTGDQPLLYQWQFNGVDLAQGTDSILSLANIQSAQSGNYRVIVSNPLGAATSVVAVVTVPGPPVIIQPPVARRVIEGEDVTLTVEAAGPGPLTFQWRRDHQPISGATNAVLFLPNVRLSDAGNYQVQVTNPYGNELSPPALLEVVPRVVPPSILVPPRGTNVPVGGAFSLAVVADGTSPLTYAWTKDGVPLSDNYRISGSASPILSVNSAILSDAGLYRVTVANPAGTTQSVATVTVTQDACLVLAEDFEDGVLDPRITVTRVGSFSALPGIKSISNFGSTRAFGFGRSTCGASCFESFATVLTIRFPSPTYVSSLSFREMELYGNWGSKGSVYTNGIEMATPYIGRSPSNDGRADSTNRTHAVPLNAMVTTVALRIWDITTDSEIFIDDLQIAGGCQGISIEDTTVSEAIAEQAQATFALRLSSPITNLVRVAYATADGTAKADLDYEPTNGWVTFGPGLDETNASVSVRIIGDSDYENAETFFVTLSQPTNAVIVGGQATGTILNDDAPPDLVSTNVLMSNQLIAGRTVVASWTTVNRGLGRARGDWVDIVWVSRDGRTNGAEFVGAFPINKVLSAGRFYTRSQNITIPAQLEGLYFLVVDVNATRSVLEVDYTNNVTGVPITIERPPAPNLQLTYVLGPTSVFAGQKTLVQWAVTNVGNLSTLTNTWEDAVYLSANEYLDGSDVFLGSRLNAGFLESGRAYENTLEVSIPARIQGFYYYIVRTDWRNQLHEGGFEGDNIGVSVPRQVILPPTPDLTVTAVTAPFLEFFSGTNYTLCWTVANAGGGRTDESSWHDRVYLSSNPTRGSDDVPLCDVVHSGVLTSNQSYTACCELALPIGVSGSNFYFIVETDYRDEAWEYVFENNNTRAVGPFIIHLSPPPDLEVETVTVPTNGHAGQQITVSYRVQNNGFAGTPNHSWNDGIYLSADNIFNPGSDRWLPPPVPHAGQLARDAGYNVSQTVRLPIDTAGSRYVIVVADYQDVVFETNNLNNWRASATPIQIQELADLQAGPPVLPAGAFAGFTFAATYRVTNAGPSATLAGAWNDAFYLSADTTLNASEDRRLTAVPARHAGVLGIGGFSERTVSLQAPLGLTGEYYVIVVTDRDDEVPERNEGNNSAVSSSRLNLQLASNDLQVVSIDLPTNGLSGFALSLRYAVTNQGTQRIPNGAWSDSIYLSRDRTLDLATDLPLASPRHTDGLGAGGAYTNSRSLRIPDGLAGEYYMLVATDSDHEVHERVETNNVLSSTNPVTLVSIPPDLVVDSCRAPAHAIAGTTILVEWTVRNVGVGQTSVDGWSDEILLSSDLIPSNAGDRSLGLPSHAGALLPGQSYSTTRSVTIPTSTPAGTYQVLLHADARSQVYEASAEGNNTRATPITVTRPNVDLVVADLGVPGEAEAGQRLTLSWTVRNLGDSRTGASAWVDRIYFAEDLEFESNVRSMGAYFHASALGAGGSNRVSATIDLPWDLVPEGQGYRDYYVRVRADDADAVAESVEDNNVVTTATALGVREGIPPDLATESVIAPTNALSGQTLNVSWTVRAGTVGTSQDWYDAVFLSLDDTLDRGSDLILGYVQHLGGLPATLPYSTNHVFDLPAGMEGSFYVIAVADSRDEVYEGGGAKEINKATAPGKLWVRLPPPTDLVATRVEATGGTNVGETIAVTYSVANESPNAVEGRWQDAVYLSSNREWDVTDALVARVPIAQTLPPGISYTQTVSALVPGVLPGDYYVLVRADVRNQIPEGDEANNITTTLAARPVEIRELFLGVPQTNELATGTEHFYKVNTPADEVLSISVDSAASSGFTELFTRFGNVPTRVEHDRSSPSPFAPDQQIVVPNTAAGYYYNLVRGQEVPSATADYWIQADLIPFEIRSVSPSRIGDHGQVTLTVRGARFAAGAEVELVNAGQRLPAATVILISQAELKARFLFANAPRGTYDVQVRNPGGDTAVAANAVVIEAATGLLVQTGLDGNLSPRLGNASDLQAAVKNVGNVDLPYLVVQARVPGGGAWSIRRPASTLPKPEEPGVLFVEDAFAGDVGAFLARDVEPGATLSFSMRIQSVQTSTLVSVAAIPKDRDAFLLGLGDAMGDLRGAFLTQREVQFSAAVSQVASDPVAWNDTFTEAMRSAGMIDPGDPLMETGSGFPPSSGSGSLLCGACPLLNAGCDILEIIDWLTTGQCELSCVLEHGPDPRSILACLLLECVLQPLIVDLGCQWLETYCETHCLEEPGCGTTRGTPEVALGRICPQRPIDPNELVGPAGFGAQKFVGVQAPLLYTVLFENRPDATAHARRIRVRSKPDNTFDLRAVRLGEVTFGAYRVAVPENVAFYQTRVQLGPDLDNLLAEVTAGVDVQSGEVFWSLTAIDPATGEPPESAFRGLLPPNAANRVGEGSVSYFIRPRDGLSTGDGLTNRAAIIFDNTEPFDTNPVWNTVDAHPPDTWVVSVVPFPVSCDIALALAGEDDAGGSGLQGKDVYVSDNNGPVQVWLAGTTLASVSYPGFPGHSYRFYSRGRDNAGNSEDPPTAPDVTVVLPPLPEMEPISMQVARVGQSIVITNRLRDPNAPRAGLTFELLARPDGARINETNGVFQWTPSCAQGSSTNLVTVRASYGGAGSCLSSTQSFLIVVNECVEVGLGEAVVAAGGSATIPVRLLSTVQLTNLTFVVEHAGLFRNWAVKSNDPVVVVTLGEVAGTLSVQLAARPGLVLFGPSQPLELEFTARPGLPSAFVPVPLADVQGTQPDGQPVANEVGVPGRVVVIGSQPLLEARLAAQGNRELILYGNPNVLYTLQWKTNLATNAVWILDRTLRPTDLRQVLQPRGDDRIFYRAYE